MFARRKTTKAWLQTLERRVSSAAVILENSAGQVLVVKANYKSYWTFPGGIVDKDETPKQTAAREVFEEVGLRLEPESLQFVGVIDRKSDFAETYQFVFKAPLLRNAAQHITLQSSELDNFALVTKSHIQSGDRVYGKAVELWAAGVSGYSELVVQGKDKAY